MAAPAATLTSKAKTTKNATLGKWRLRSRVGVMVEPHEEYQGRVGPALRVARRLAPEGVAPRCRSLKPAANTEREANIVGVFAIGAREVGRPIEFLLICDADIGRELAGDLVAEPQSGIEIG
jgi:hypothetical protein